MILFFLIVILKDPRGPKKALGQKYNHKRQLIKSPIKKTEKLTFLYKQQCSPHCRHGRQGRIPPEQHFVKDLPRIRKDTLKGIAWGIYECVSKVLSHPGRMFGMIFRV